MKFIGFSSDFRTMFQTPFKIQNLNISKILFLAITNSAKLQDTFHSSYFLTFEQKNNSKLLKVRRWSQLMFRYFRNRDPK